MRHAPGLDEVFDDLRVSQHGVGPDPLRDRREIVEQVGVLTVEHVAPGHGDDALDHPPEGQDARLGLSLHRLADDPGVERLMARLVAGDLPADPGEVLVPLLGGELAHIAVGDPRRSFLESRVDQCRTVVALVPRIESVADQVMDRPLDGPHVHPAREPEVGVEQVAMPVLLRGPPPQPTSPGGVVDPGPVTGDAIQRDGVTRQGLLRDHVAHQDDQQLVGDRPRGSRNRVTCSAQSSAVRSGRKSVGCQA